MGARATRSDISQIAKVLAKTVGMRPTEATRNLLYGEAKSQRSQFSPLADGITHVKPNSRPRKMPLEFWAWKNGTGWSVSLEIPETKAATPSIPVHHHSLVKWASNQKNLDLVQQAIDIENRREKPRPTVTAALDKALHKYDMEIN